MDKQEIVERVARKCYGLSYIVFPELAKVHEQDIDLHLTAAGYFDLLEAARDMAMQHRYTSHMDNHEKIYCFECHQEWGDKHKSTCSTGALLEILRKAGVKFE